MADRPIINNNPNITRNTLIQKTYTTNVQPRRNLGRGGAYALESANSWFGGLVDTLTGFGVFKFFFLVFLFLTFLRTLFTATGVIPDLDFFELLELLNSVDVIDYSWIDKFSNFMTKYVIPNTLARPGSILYSLQDILNIIANVIWVPVRAILYLLTGVTQFSTWLGVIINWFALGGV